MELYTKKIDGRAIIKPRNKIVVVKDDRQYINPSHELLIEDGWELYVEPQPTEAEKLDNAKFDLQREIESYDSSSEVNIFYIGGIPMWLDKATRAGLMLRFQAEIAAGKEDTILWYNGVQYPLSLSQAMQMLYAIELYASQCYDMTQAHLANVDGLESIEEVESYNYTTGYPAQLEF